MRKHTVLLKIPFFYISFNILISSCHLNTFINKSEIPDIFHYKSHTYFFVRKKTTWHTANQICLDAGGHLLFVENKKENEFIRSIINSDTWIGLSDQTKETDWEWTNGTKISFSDWYEREPNNLYEQEHYAHYMEVVNYRWNDNSNEKRFQFVCEFDELIKGKNRLKHIQARLNDFNELDPFPFTAEMLLADFEYIVNAVKDVHCSTIDGLSKEQEMVIAEIQNRIPGTNNYHDYFDLLNRFFLTIPDPNTMLKFTFPIAQYQFPCYWTDEGLYTSRNIYQFKPGDRIISINGFPEKELRKIARENFKSYNIEKYNENLSEIFNDFFLHKFILQNNQDLKFNIKRNNDRLQTLELMLPVADLKHTTDKEKHDPAFYYLNEHNSFAVFGINYMSTNKKYQALLSEFFKMVYENQIKNIVIDLRQTKGGNSKATDYLLEYLAVDKINRYETWQRYSREIKNRWGWGNGFGMEVFDNKKKSVNHDNVRQEHIFKGKIYVLISRATRGGNWIAAIFKDNRIGTFIGESTLRPGEFFGDNLYFKLPFTGIEFTIAQKKFIRPDQAKRKQTGIKPDIKISMSINDYLNGKDPYLEYLKKELINENKD